MTRVFFICVTGVPVILKEFDLTGKVAIVTGAARGLSKIDILESGGRGRKIKETIKSGGKRDERRNQ